MRVCRIPFYSSSYSLTGYIIHSEDVNVHSLSLSFFLSHFLYFPHTCSLPGASFALFVNFGRIAIAFFYDLFSLCPLLFTFLLISLFLCIYRYDTIFALTSLQNANNRQNIRRPHICVVQFTDEMKENNWKWHEIYLRIIRYLVQPDNYKNLEWFCWTRFSSGRIASCFNLAANTFSRMFQYRL